VNEQDIIDKVIKILVSYTLISNIYMYVIHCDGFEGDYKIRMDANIDSVNYKQNERINQNIFSMCMHDMYNKAQKNLDKITNKFEKSLHKITSIENFALIKSFIENYPKLLLDVFPKNGLMVLNHNDVHRLNIMQNKEKELKILDHEYAGLNLIGIDIVNYLIETNFDYTKKSFPFYTFTKENINFENYFEIFQQFLKNFEIAHAEDLKNIEYRRKFNKVKSYKYFLRLVCIVSLFWLLWGIIYFDLVKMNEMKSFDYFGYTMDRLFIFQKAYSELKSYKINKIELN